MQTLRIGWVLVVLLLATACSSGGGRADGSDGASDRSRTDLYYRGDGACPEGESAACMSAQGTPAFKVCQYGRWTDCTWECTPGSLKTCAGGAQRCVDGKWTPCA